MEVVNEAPYPRNRPKSFVESADVILKLDSGDRLPAHSALLSLHSEVLSDMLSLDRSGDTGLLILPFPDCTLDAAQSFLQRIYSTSYEDKFSVEGAGMVAELATKFGMDGILKDIDKFLAEKVAPDGSSQALWVRTYDSCPYYLRSITRYTHRLILLVL